MLDISTLLKVIKCPDGYIVLQLLSVIDVYIVKI